MAIWISKQSFVNPLVQDRQSFYSVKVELDDPMIEAAALGMEADIRAYHRYLHALMTEARAAHGDINKLEVPECLRPAEAPSAEPPKKKATGARSSKASRKPRKKKASSSSTSQKKAE